VAWLRETSAYEAARFNKPRCGARRFPATWPTQPRESVGARPARDHENARHRPGPQPRARLPCASQRLLRELSIRPAQRRRGSLPRTSPADTLKSVVWPKRDRRTERDPTRGISEPGGQRRRSGMHAIGSEVVCPSAQFIECHPGAPPACLGQAQSSFARVRPRREQSGRRNPRQRVASKSASACGQLRVAMATRSFSRLRRRRTPWAPALARGTSGIKSATLTSKVASLPGQPGQRTQALESSAARGGPAVFARPQAEHAQAARATRSGESVLLCRPGLLAIGKQPLHVLTQELRGGLLALLFSPFHGLRVWNEKQRRTKITNDTGV